MSDAQKEAGRFPAVPDGRFVVKAEGGPPPGVSPPEPNTDVSVEMGAMQGTPAAPAARSDSVATPWAPTRRPPRWRFVALGIFVGFPTGVAVSAAVRPALIQETRFVAFDQASKPLLGGGWSEPEITPRKETFAWCAAKTCVLFLHSRADADRVIGFIASPFRYPGSPEQSVELILNGTSLGRFPVTGAIVPRASAPKRAWKRGRNELRFVFAYAEAPNDHVPDNPDPRSLAASFAWVAVTGS